MLILVKHPNKKTLTMITFPRAFRRGFRGIPEPRDRAPGDGPLAHAPAGAHFLSHPVTRSSNLTESGNWHDKTDGDRREAKR
jgi:hypothetical protein